MLHVVVSTVKSDETRLFYPVCPTRTACPVAVVQNMLKSQTYDQRGILAIDVYECPFWVGTALTSSCPIRGTCGAVGHGLLPLRVTTVLQMLLKTRDAQEFKPTSLAVRRHDFIRIVASNFH